MKQLRFQGKKILMLYATFFHYSEHIRQKLISLGAEVDLYDARVNISSVEKAVKKAEPFFYYRKQERYHRSICASLAGKRYDYIYTNENLTRNVLQLYQKQFPSARLILSMDDSVRNLGNVAETFDLYDRVLTFDRKDAEQYGLQLRPLFFNDDFAAMKDAKTELLYDLCFIGTIHSDRLRVLNALKKQAGSSFFYCYLPAAFMYDYYRVTDPAFSGYQRGDFQYTAISSREVTEKAAQSRVIVDIEHPRQTGLTMRTIETLGLGKKLITTNADIRNYDFYDPQNICIIDRRNPVLDPAFLEREYKPVDAQIYEKYSLTHWVSDVFA